jgi:hypothetical protein
MGIETIIFIFALIIGGAIWSLSRKARRGGPGQPSSGSRPRR